MASFDITVRTAGSLHPDGEPDRFVSEYVGVVTCTDDRTGEQKKVSKVTALRIHAGLAEDAGESLFDVCDCHSGELQYLHSLLYETDQYHFRDTPVNRFEAVPADLLVLDYVVVAPKWRKLKLGLLAVRKLVNLVGGGCGLAVSHVAPVRHDAAPMLAVPAFWLPRHRGQQEVRAATVKLRRYFRGMGFERLGRTPYYALPLNLMTPTAGELLGGA